jgi:hypothetical protein
MMTRTKSLLAATGVGLCALLVAGPAKAFIVFAPAAFAGVIIGAVAFGTLLGGTAVANRWLYAPPPPVAYGPAVYTSAGYANGCYPATVRIHGHIHHVQVCD